VLPLPAKPPERPSYRLRQDPGDGDGLAKYWTFYWAVAAAQLARWLPRRPSRVLDISGGQSAAQAAAAGHTVLQVLDTPPAPRPGPNGRVHPLRGAPQGTVRPLVGDSATLGFLADGCVDAVIAEDRVLSRHLVTETTVQEIARVLRPGGRVLLCVDSLMLGMAILAEQNYWAHLSDVPQAEVVLVPWPDGTITRCFWSEQLRELLTDAALEVEWIRPRTALSASTVEHVLANDPKALARLVRTELTAPVSDESVGIHLIASARRV
jgi:SAM-dependent methyltransferase